MDFITAIYEQLKTILFWFVAYLAFHMIMFGGKLTWKLGNPIEQIKELIKAVIK